MHVDDKYYFNFADCSPIAGRAGVREYLFGKATGQEDLCLFAAKDFQAGQGQLITDEVKASKINQPRFRMASLAISFMLVSFVEKLINKKTRTF